MSNNELRVWWVPQVPGSAFYVPVTSLEQAKLVMDVLARYDLFQYQQNIKPDYVNAGGLEEYDVERGGWVTWYSADGDDFDEWLELQDD